MFYVGAPPSQVGYLIASSLKDLCQCIYIVRKNNKKQSEIAERLAVILEPDEVTSLISFFDATKIAADDIIFLQVYNACIALVLTLKSPNGTQLELRKRSIGR